MHATPTKSGNSLDYSSTPSPLSADDLPLLLQEIEHFAQTEIAPHCRQPELAMTPACLQQIAATADANGLLAGDDDSAVGLWQAPQDGLRVSFSCQMLQLLATHNAGCAYDLHQRSLSRWLARQLGVTSAMLPLTQLQGRYGLARHALARLLQQRATDADRLLLRDYWNLSGTPSLLLLSAVPWDNLLSPGLRADGSLGWRRLQSTVANLHPAGPLHGLDELQGHDLQVTDNATEWQPVDSRRAQELLIQALQMQALGLLAIAAGSVQASLRQAIEYARQRHQGGVAIHQHPAVQELLMDAQIKLRQAQQALSQCTQQGLDANSLANVFAARAAHQAQLSQAASQTLQVFGGMGYMQDVGMEKRLRDCNMLRLLDGTTSDLKLFLAAWEEIV